MKPQTRRGGLLVRELPDELLVYDQEQHRAHCLNRTAALVFRNADGSRTEAELARLLGPGADEAVVKLTLDELAGAGLLEPAASGGDRSPAGRISRRDVARRMGLAAAILLPAVASIVAPTPAEAAATCVSSCVGQPNGITCDVCGAGILCSTAATVCSGGACTDGCPG